MLCSGRKEREDLSCLNLNPVIEQVPAGYGGSQQQSAVSALSEDGDSRHR